METILKYEKKYIQIFSVLIGMFLLNFVFYLFDNHADISFSLYLGINAVLFGLYVIVFKFKYFNQFNVYMAIKYLNLFAAGFMFFNENVFVFGMGALIYVVNCVEMLLINVHEDKKGLLYIVFSYIPLVVCLAIIFVFKDSSIYSILFVASFIVFLIGIYQIIQISAAELNEKIVEQHALWESSLHANELLMRSQEKIKGINEKILHQKQEMEQKNNQLNRLSSEMYIQNELLNYISSTLDLDQLMDLVTDAIVGAIGVDTCTLLIKNTDNETYVIKSKSKSDVNIVIQSIRDEASHHRMDCYFEDKKSILNSNVSRDDYPFIKYRNVGSLIITPLIRNNQVYGLIISEHESTDFFGEYNLQFFENIATQITIAYNNASVYAKLEEIATTDGLTSIYNRRNFQLLYGKLFDETKRKSGMLSVIMMDIDKFKNVNDTYGHLFGDEAIKMVARFTKQFSTKYNGFSGRYGGEEFVLVIPDQVLEETVGIIQEMHEAIQTESLLYKGKIVHINVSIGISHYPDFGLSAEDLLNRADNAMYYSKRHGRGCITVDSVDLNIMEE